MELGVIFILIALFLSVAFYLAAPLLGDRARHVTQESQEMSSLLAERDRLINSLQELDFDFKLGKIPEEDYPPQRAELLQKGADVLRKLDALSSSPAEGVATDEGSSAESRLEKAAASRRADAAARAEPLSDDEIESMLAGRRKARKSKAAGFCPRCGKPVLASDQFCQNCGKALTNA